MHFFTLLSLSAAVASAAYIPKRQESTAQKHVVVYYQTRTDDKGNYVSMASLEGKATHLMIAPWHIHDGGSTANTTPPTKTKRDPAVASIVIGGTETDGASPDDASTFQPMYDDITKLRNSGMKVMAMLGGYQDESFNKLDTDFDTHYSAFKDALSSFPPGLDGVDIDMEPTGGGIQLSTVTKLVTQLKSDFPNFIITMAPVSESMIAGNTDGYTGISYQDLESQVGNMIDFYNVQFYCGHLPLTADNYLKVIKNSDGTGGGFVAPERIVTGMLAVKACDAGIVDVPGDFIPNLLPAFQKASGNKFAGVSSWEFFGPFPDGITEPAQWATQMSQALNGGS